MKNSSRIRNKVFAGLLITVICMAAAFGMCKCYGIIKKMAVNKEYNYFETHEFQSDLLEYCYAIASQMSVDKEDDKGPKPSELFFNEAEYFDDEQNSDDDMIRTDARERFDTSFDYWNRRLDRDDYNLKYYALAGDKMLSNDQTLKRSDIEKGKYQFFVKFTFDKGGAVTVSGLKGAERIDFNKSEYLEWMDNGTGQMFKPIKDMSILFAVPTHLVGEGEIAEGIREQRTLMYSEPAIIVVLLWIALIAIIALVFPYSLAKEFYLFKIPFELWMIGVGTTFVLAGIFARFGVGETIAHETILIGEFVVTHAMIMSGNLIGWFLIFLVVFLGVLELKSSFILGIKESFKQRTITGRVIICVIRAYNKTLNYITQIDLREKNNKYIMKLLGINAIVLFLITCVWLAGIPIVIAYTIFLYVVFKKYVDIISKKYSILAEATNQMAEGNLDVTIEEDLGLFNPFKENLEEIQGGFKKAVEEEVKSQRMKTDLISNVSHDLKTPLTAIITYTDLLQDKSLSEEKRSEYLEVLEHKAERLQVLIEDLFEMSKVSSGTVQMNLEEVDVVSLMKQTLIEVEDQLKNASLTVKTTFSSERIIRQLDSERMYRVFENLLLNASKYAMKNTRLFIDILEQEDHVMIEVKNISAEEITFDEQEIVERFIRGDKSRNTEGSGLGLAIAKSFVELQGGKFQIDIDGDLFKAIITL